MAENQETAGAGLRLRTRGIRWIIVLLRRRFMPQPGIFTGFTVNLLPSGIGKRKLIGGKSLPSCMRVLRG